MSGSHVAPSSRHSSQQYNNRNSGGGGGWKVAVLVVVLIIAVAALGFLLWQLFGEDIMGMIGGEPAGGSANVAPGIFTQVDAEYGNGKNVASNLTVNQGTQRPAEIPADAENVVLLDISWTGEKEQTEPVYLTVSDPSFTDGDGLSVYQYDEPQQTWDLVGTYRIQDSSVTFQTASMTSFAFQVISSNPVATASPEPIATAEPTITPAPTPEPTPEPLAVVDYGEYTTVQTGAFTAVDHMEDDEVYVLALVENMPADESPAEEEEQTESTEENTTSAVDFTYVDAPAATDVPQTAETGEAAAAATPAPKATVLFNKGGNALGAVEMPLVQNDDGDWCLAGPITEGMLWTSDQDYVNDENRYALGNNDRYLNIDDNYANIILNDDSLRTRWLIESATLANNTTVRTVNYRDGERYYVSALGIVTEAISDSLFPAGDAPDEPNPQAQQVTYLGTAAPADQTMYQNTLRFSVSSDASVAQHVILFKLDPDATMPANVQTAAVSGVTVPVIDANTDLSTLDIRDGDALLQLGVDYTVAAKVYNNSTVVVVISFMGKYSGQVVRTYEGTYFRTDANAPTPTPEPTATPAPVYTGGGGGGGGTSTGTGTWVPEPQEEASSTNTGEFVDDESATDSE